ncbi:MarR family winged helix-turn-helix transcriptional regulator [Actinocrispum wychmicini]|uniref:DNA-binding MarR family transcriptional regulator n=1 Tax=Actinocrispum wychmicini TaxID=1213861 RepID=A0A4R2JU22_9PSEU|nr:MarR family winged helix-turn-helix transcriptional regulator [Actinocrispum wychmicini]TCO62522.1 DNA-binding MarR family transcriptional regulator [Actinocrispum wychmicini]
MSGALLPRETSLGYQVNHLARLLENVLRDRIAPLGVAPGQFAQLLALYEQDGLTQAELCARVRIEQSTMANTLGRMAADGLVERVPDPADGRRSLVLLTERARELQADLVAAARAVNTAATRGLDDDAVAAFMAALPLIIANLESVRAGSKP